MGYYRVNHMRNRIDIFFDGIPSEDARDELKSHGWAYYRPARCWYNYYSIFHEDFANEICGG